MQLYNTPDAPVLIIPAETEAAHFILTKDALQLFGLEQNGTARPRYFCKFPQGKVDGQWIELSPGDMLVHLTANGAPHRLHIRLKKLNILSQIT